MKADPIAVTTSYDVVASMVLFNTPLEEIERTISSLCNSAFKIHIILVDNTPGGQSLPNWLLDGLEVIRPGTNLGYGRGHNLALCKDSIKCRYNLILNTDLHFTGADIDELVTFMDATPDVGMTSPRITYPDGEIQRLCRLLPNPANLFGRAFLPFLPIIKALDDRYQFQKWDYASQGNFPYLSGCFMLVRRTIIEKIGPFDERYFMFLEDVDFSRRIHAVSKTIFYPEITITHDYRSRTAFNYKLMTYKMVSACKYFTKWGWIIDPERTRVNDRAVSVINNINA